jgi:hypothetical protein
MALGRRKSKESRIIPLQCKVLGAEGSQLTNAAQKGGV